VPTYSAVLFDFFGTLTMAVQRGSQHAIVARILGCELTAMISILDQSFRSRSRGVFGDAAATLRWVCDQLGVDPTTRQVQAAVQARVAALSADTTLRPDAVATLSALRRRGLRTAVVSDCCHELPVLLPRLRVAPLLDAAVYSVDVGECKPHPAMYRRACERLRVDPEQCLYVGDGGSRELTGATLLGMTAVRLAAPDLGRHLVFEADQDWTGPEVTSLSETLDLVDHAPALV